MTSGEAADRPPHVIRREEVAAWLADSAVKQVTRHWSSTESVEAIHAAGVRIERTALDSTWGQGFYTTTGFRPEWGDTPLSVAVRLRRPFVIVDRISALEEIDELLSAAASEDVRDVLQVVGYDGVMIHWESGEVWAIAFTGDQVKVVEER